MIASEREGFVGPFFLSERRAGTGVDLSCPSRLYFAGGHSLDLKETHQRNRSCAMRTRMNTC